MALFQHHLHILFRRNFFIVYISQLERKISQDPQQTRHELAQSDRVNFSVSYHDILGEFRAELQLLNGKVVNRTHSVENIEAGHQNRQGKNFRIVGFGLVDTITSFRI
jgi:hypothetical protein